MVARRGSKGRFVKAVEDGANAAGTAKRADETRGRKGRKLRLKPAHEQIAEALPLIVGKFVTKAKGGSIPHAKALAALGEMDRVTGGSRQRSQRREQSLTERLMRELRRGRGAETSVPPEPEAGEPVDVSGDRGCGEGGA